MKPTSIQIKHTRVVDAANYVFEFSKDADFTNVDRTVVILADTLTPFADSNTAMKVEYRTWFDGLTVLLITGYVCMLRMQMHH